jgi:hypothetical protein
MNTPSNNNSFKKLAQFGQVAGCCLLFLHFYYACYWFFEKQHLTIPLLDRLVDHLFDTVLLHSYFFTKTMILGCFALSVRNIPRGTDRYSVVQVVVVTLIGWMVYMFNADLLPTPGIPMLKSLFYMGATVLGLVICLFGLSQGYRFIEPFLQHEDVFGHAKGSFPQEERRLVTDFSFHLPAYYTWQGDIRQSWINLINPRRGIFIMGSPGSGKSWFIIEPLLRQSLEKGYALFLYDFKYDALTRLAYHYYKQNEFRFPPGTAFYNVNFSDVSRSHRCNLLEPSTLEWVSDALGASRTVLLSLNKSWVHKQGEFFVESPINFLGALIWFLRNYEKGKYCTLPHAIELAQVPYDKLFSILSSDVELKSLINPFLAAYKNKSFEMLDSQISSAKIPLGRLSSPDLYYILTGNDVTLDINNPAAPKIFCLGGNPARQEALAPVLSLYIDRINQLCNRPGQHPCVLCCDEFATVRAYSMATMMATARSNNIIPILSVQDLNQLRTQYSRAEAETFLSIAGNLFCGQAGGDTARWVSERMPRIKEEKTSTSVNSKDTSVSISSHWENTVTPATISTLSSGEFVGLVADDPGKELKLKSFHARIVRREPPAPPVTFQLPQIQTADETAIIQHYHQIKKDVHMLVNTVLGNMPKDPLLVGQTIK